MKFRGKRKKTYKEMKFTCESFIEISLKSWMYLQLKYLKLNRSTSHSFSSYYPFFPLKNQEE